jgi:hypothetical protein
MGVIMKKKSHNNKTFGEISGKYWSSLKKNAKKRNIQITVTIEEAWLIFLKQNRRCFYTGLKITHKKYLKRINNKDIYSLGTASLDRKNSNLDYTKENIQWVHKDVNYMKMSLNEKYFIKLCKLISRRF